VFLFNHLNDVSIIYRLLQMQKGADLQDLI